MNSDSNFYDPNKQIPNPYEPTPPGPPPSNPPYSPPPNNQPPPPSNPPYSPPGNQLGSHPPYPTPPGYQSSPSHPPYPSPQGQRPDAYQPYPPVSPVQMPQQEYPVPPPPMYNPGNQPPKSRLTTGTRIGIIVLVVLIIIIGAISIAIPVHNNQVASANATATALVHGHITATAQVHATATAQMNATATAIASTYPFSANLKLHDPLTDNSHGYGWETSTFCSFKGGAYHSIDDQSNTYSTCSATQTNFLNFTYQVSMQVVKGDLGGITFRGDTLTPRFYAFVLGSGGFYTLSLYTNNGPRKSILEGTVPAFDLTQPNTIGVVARGNKFDLYVNQQQIATQTDNTYSSGQIGMISYGQGEAAYTNAQVWAL